MYWNKVIDHWCESLGKYGLTIPYLIGIERTFAKRSNFDIEDLLNEINDSTFGKKYIISSCNDLDEYIIGAHKSEYTFIQNMKRFDTLVINNSVLEEFENIAQLSNYLTDLYSFQVENSLFSIDYDSLEWNSFKEDEMKEINSVLGN